MLYLLIDGDMVCFRACSSVEREIDWGNDIWTLHVDLNEAKEYFETIMDTIIEDALDAHKYSGDSETCRQSVSSGRHVNIQMRALKAAWEAHKREAHQQ